MATHSSILARKPHGQRKLVGYSPWGLKKLDTAEHFEYLNDLKLSALYSNSSSQDVKLLLYSGLVCRLIILSIFILLPFKNLIILFNLRVITNYFIQIHMLKLYFRG